MSELTGQVNQYRCSDCRHTITTINVDDGTTPMFLRCEQCGGRSVSSMYRVDQTLAPSHAWYRPKSFRTRNRDLRQHLEQGGLLIRSLTERQASAAASSPYPDNRQGRRRWQRERAKAVR